MEKVGIFGGSFNPVHNGHLVMAHEAREQAGLNRLLLIPVHLSPHKSSADLLPGDVRLRLLRAACEGQPGLEVDDREIRRGGTSWSIETIRELRRSQPANEWYFLIGQDSLWELPQWKDAEELAHHVTFLVAGRPASLSDPSTLTGLPAFRLRRLSSTLIGISSTQVRERARAGLPLGGFVPEKVADAIFRDRLYQR